MVSDEELRKIAKEKAKEKIGFYVHFSIYILVNIFLFLQWYWITEGTGFPWVIPTTVGWGIGIVAHFLGVFVIDPHSEKLEEKEYQKLKEKNR
jgi:uncharacterized protein (DUF486 family)